MKKKIIIIVIIVAIIGIGVWMYLKGKAKTALAAGSPSVAGSGSSPVAGSGLAASAGSSNSGPVSPVVLANKNNNPGGVAMGYTGVQKDKSQGKAVICYQPVTTPLAVGDSINIPSGPYAGVSKIWYIYPFDSGGFAAGPGVNLYIDKPFTANDKGTFYKV